MFTDWRKTFLIVLPFVCFAVGAGALAVVLNLTGQRRELKEWKSAPSECPTCVIASCPRFGGYPLLWTSELPTVDVAGALEALNAEVQKHLPEFGPVWKQAPVGYTGKRVVVSFVWAPAVEYEGGICSEAGDSLGAMVDQWDGSVLRGVKVHICVKRFEEAARYKTEASLAEVWKLPNDRLKAFYRINKLGFLGILLHEGAHAMFPSHPAWGCGLMCASPTQRGFTAHEIAILKDHVLKPCKESGLLNLPL